MKLFNRSTVPSAERSARLARTGAAGGALTALAAGACCLGPPILMALGFGGAAVAMSLAPLRPYMIAGALLFLGGGFYLAYGPMESACRADDSCIPGKVRTVTKVMLWTATILTVVFLTADRWIGLLS